MQYVTILPSAASVKLALATLSRDLAADAAPPARRAESGETH